MRAMSVAFGSLIAGAGANIAAPSWRPHRKRLHRNATQAGRLSTGLIADQW
jgi:uncharacterized membrane protein YccC